MHDRATPPQPDHPELVLEDTPDGLRLTDHGEARPRSIAIDFTGGPTARRVRALSRKRHPLARAVGRNQPLPHVLDGTAGLGRDAFVLAALGYRVTAVERSPVLYAMLADAVHRLLDTAAGRQLVGDRLTVIAGDCRDFLTTTPPPEVVYLDPMFPGRDKSALVKKELRMLQKLLPAAESAADQDRALLTAARRAARRRVVVKRPRRAPPLADGVSYAVPGTAVRWDVYLTPGADAPADR